MNGYMKIVFKDSNERSQFCYVRARFEKELKRTVVEIIEPKESPWLTPRTAINYAAGVVYKKVLERSVDFGAIEWRERSTSGTEYLVRFTSMDEETGEFSGPMRTERRF